LRFSPRLHVLEPKLPGQKAEGRRQGDHRLSDFSRAGFLTKEWQSSFR
jgi:hypothetical protein